MAELQRCPVCSMTICIRCGVLFISLAVCLSLCALNEVTVCVHGGGGVGYIGILFDCILSRLVVFSEPPYVTRCDLWWCFLNHHM